MSKTKSKKWLVEINADWGRNITKRVYNDSPQDKQSAQNATKEIKDKFGDPSLESKVISVKPLED